ncbi:MAG: TadE/TadG family type IV pilus assembly protein [Pseudomonadota bacterium]
MADGYISSSCWQKRAEFRLLSRCLRCRQGVALIEMAITMPVLLTLLFGIMAYGEWFFVSHTIQQTANNAARAALAGLTKEERYAIALKAVKGDSLKGSTLDASKVGVVVEDDGMTIVVRLSYSAAADPLLSTGLVPLPGKTISRSAAVLLGGV